MAHKNNSIGGCRACEARRALPEALVQGGLAAAEGAKAVHRGFLSRFQGGFAAAEGGESFGLVRVLVSRKEQIVSESGLGRKAGVHLGTVLRFSRNPVTFYGETLDNPDLA